MKARMKSWAQIRNIPNVEKYGCHIEDVSVNWLYKHNNTCGILMGDRECSCDYTSVQSDLIGKTIPVIETDGNDDYRFQRPRTRAYIPDWAIDEVIP